MYNSINKGVSTMKKTKLIAVALLVATTCGTYVYATDETTNDEKVEVTVKAEVDTKEDGVEIAAEVEKALRKDPSVRNVETSVDNCERKECTSCKSQEEEENN